MSVTEVPVGRRVAYWRGRRNMSQQVFADRLGKSQSWVDKVERGVRRLDKYSVLTEIADVLRVDVGLLLGREPHRQASTGLGVDQVEIEAIRSALERYDTIIAPVTEPPPIADVRKSVRHAWLTLQYARYGVLTRALPTLLRQAEDADRDQGGTESAHLLGQAYQIASSTLRKLGEHDLARLAADRAMVASERSGDPLLTGCAAARAGLALLTQGRHRAALELHIGMATALAPTRTKPTAQQLSVHGHLLLQAAMSAARLGEQNTVRDLFASAEEVADRLGEDANHYWTSFGPTNLLLHRAAAWVELREGGRAIEIDQKISPDRFTALMPERRAHHLLDLARAHVQTGNVGEAGTALLRADQLAPAEIRSRPAAHEVMADVLRRARGSASAPVVELAEQMGVSI